MHTNVLYIAIKIFHTNMLVINLYPLIMHNWFFFAGLTTVSVSGKEKILRFCSWKPKKKLFENKVLGGGGPKISKKSLFDDFLLKKLKLFT